ncbi:Transcription factor E [uncultured archaeon]|nr:Transcription factor E [uncultured archaeon]
MLKDSLKEVVGSIVGKQAEGIVDLLDGNNYINEFIIAKKLDITINQARNILYKLSDYGLVSSTRKKDKKKGWYTYFWKLEVLKSLEFLKGIFERNIQNLQNQISSRETKQFFSCQRCNVEFNEESALQHNFTCQECGDVFQLKDNSKLVKDLKRNLDKLNSELKLVLDEIEKEREKVGKKRASEMKREDKKKAKDRATKRAVAKKLRDANKPKKVSKKIIKKAKKKVVKKVVKKKTSKKIKKSKKK